MRLASSPELYSPLFSVLGGIRTHMQSLRSSYDLTVPSSLREHMAATVGLEPTASPLTGACSTN